ncbi:MAG: spore maturation protein A [Clostridia bacterium]|nr:spore maturation protein A [Clostridia bacterium]
MLGKTFGVMCIVSFIAAGINGRVSELSAAVFTGAARAVELTVSLLGMMCLWCGVMNVLKDAGAIEKAARLISPVLKFLFPTAYKTGNGIDECAANISANLLGIGNAATPFAISALKKMQLDNPTPERASDDMITLAVMNSSPISLMPMTLITLRNAAGSTDASRILVPVWICSFFGSVLSVLLSRALAVSDRKRRKKKT